jgi:hypothetical protein
LSARDPLQATTRQPRRRAWRRDARADATLAAPTYDIVLFTDHPQGDAALAAVDPTRLILLPGGSASGLESTAIPRSRTRQRDRRSR